MLNLLPTFLGGHAWYHGDHDHQIALVILITILNTAISWLNASVCGRSWEESKACGGIVRLVVWCTAIQSAIGFSSALILPLLYIAHENLPGYFTDRYFDGALSLWYMTIVFPVIGAGLAITIESWVAAYRDASLLRLSNAAWNTFAQIHNTYNAVTGMGQAFQNVASFFSGSSRGRSDSDKDDRAGVLIILLVLLALLAGVLTTAAIIHRVAGGGQRIPLDRPPS